MLKMIRTNKIVDKALEVYAFNLPQRAQVQFLLTTTEGETHDLKTLSPEKAKRKKQEPPLYLYGEGAFGGFVWNTLLMVHGMDEAVAIGNEAIFHSSDSFQPVHIAALKRLLLKRDTSKSADPNNSSTQTTPSS